MEFHNFGFLVHICFNNCMHSEKLNVCEMIYCFVSPKVRFSCEIQHVFFTFVCVHTSDYYKRHNNDANNGKQKSAGRMRHTDVRTYVVAQTNGRKIIDKPISENRRKTFRNIEVAPHSRKCRDMPSGLGGVWQISEGGCYIINTRGLALRANYTGRQADGQTGRRALAASANGALSLTRKPENWPQISGLWMLC